MFLKVSLLLLALAKKAPSTSAETSLKSSAWIDDLVEELPDFGKTPTPHFSGYLDGSDGCDVSTNGPVCNIHYWLALAEKDAPSAPVVLWLNGGPGSTSMIGFLQEEGPLLINANGGLMINPYSWTKYVNLVAIEAPVGVGYSYCSRQAEGKPCQNTDRYTASTSRAALVDFFTNKFPELAKNDFFIIGESYAGVYIPTLSKELLDNSDINLKGIAVGDPCTDDKAQDESMDSLWYGHKNGLVDDEIFHLLWDKCGTRNPNLMKRGGVHHVAHTLNKELRAIDDLKQRKIRAGELYHEVALNGNFQKLKDSPECTMAYRKFLLSSSDGLSQGWKNLYINDYSLFSPVSDLEGEQMTAYMSRDDVRKALHVEEAPTSSWPDIEIGFDYLKEFEACNWDDGDVVVKGVSMIDFYKEIVPQLDRTWIYNGDADPCVSYEGTREAVKQIQIDELDGGSYRPWFYNQTAASLDVLAEKSALFGPNLLAQDMGAQIGGEVVDYHEGLKFVTFHGSGHMVPQFMPQASLHFLKKFIDGEELSPFMPLNETLSDMSDVAFRKAENTWIEQAMSSPFVTGEEEEEDHDSTSSFDMTTTDGKTISIEQ